MRHLLLLASLLPQIASAANPAAPVPKKTPKSPVAPAHPAPGASVKPVRRAGIESRRVNGGKGLTLNPSDLPPDSVHSDGTTYFELVRKGAQWALAFRSADPHLKLGTQGSFIVQIIAPEPFKLEPAVIGAAQWPAGQTELALRARGALPAKPVWIQGSAAYLACDDRVADATKRCARAHSSFALKVSR